MSQPSDSNDAPVDAALASLEAGFLVGNGRFTLVRLIGRGGMGVVWLARDESLREDVALKFLPTEIRFDAVALDDLRRETARARKLTHPNIIRIHDLYRDERDAFISMEYVDGPNLSDLRLEQSERVFTWKFLEPLVKQLCEALDYAHGEKVIHRDLKPANLMLDSRGRLKLSDFGIAAQVSDSVSRVSMIRHSQSGTVTYMSPQQMDGRLPQVTDDIYALGATLYELLTSRPPFFTGDIAHQVRHLLPQPIDERLAELEIENEVPRSLAALIMACLGKLPEQRPTSVRAVAEWIGLQPAPPAHREDDRPARQKIEDRTAEKSSAIAVPISAPPVESERIREAETSRPAAVPPVPVDEPAPLPPRTEERVSVSAPEDAAMNSGDDAVRDDTPPRRFPVALAATALALVVILGLGVGVLAWWMWDRQAHRNRTEAPAADRFPASEFLKTERALAGHKAAVSSVAFSPDQKFLASASADGTVRVYETDRGELAWSANADLGPVTAMAISRENKLLAAAGGSGLIRLFALPSGQVIQTLRIHSSPLTAAAFSPAGPQLASADEAGTIALWDYEANVAGRHWNAHNTPIRALAFAPNGRQLASGGSQDTLVRVWNVPDGTPHKTLTGHRGIVWSLAYSADGSMLVSGSRDRSARIWNTANFSTKRTVQWNSDANLMHGVAISPDSKFLAAGAPRSVKIFKVETAARGKDRGLRGSGTMRPVAFSPDGRALAAGSDSGVVFVWPFRGEALFGGSAPETADPEERATPNALLTADPPAAASTSLADQGVNPGSWKTLFNGTSMDAWYGWKGLTWMGSWSILNQELRSLRGGTVQLATREQYGDFELELEWKITPGANSGILYRAVPGPDEVWKSAPEYQIVDDPTHRDGTTPITSCGSIFGLIAPANKSLKPAGEFNATRIVMRGSRVEHWLNGVKVLETDLARPDVRRVAVQKFGKPAWGDATRGHIVLQQVGSEVSFRNIRVRRLDAK